MPQILHYIYYFPFLKHFPNFWLSGKVIICKSRCKELCLWLYSVITIFIFYQVFHVTSYSFKLKQCSLSLSSSLVLEGPPILLESTSSYLIRSHSKKYRLTICEYMYRTWAGRREEEEEQHACGKEGEEENTSLPTTLRSKRKEQIICVCHPPPAPQRRACVWSPSTSSSPCPSQGTCAFQLKFPGR